MRSITEIDLAELVPDSIRHDDTVAAAITAINGELKAVSQLAMVPALLARIDDLTSTQLDHLAWQFDSKVWRDGWPIDRKRSVIRSVILEKSKKGTKSAVLKALSAMGSGAAIREWFEESPPGIPHTFSITIPIPDVPGQVSSETQEDLFLRIDDVKPVRSHYTVTVATQGHGGMALAGAARSAVFVRIHGQEQEVFPAYSHPGDVNGSPVNSTPVNGA